MKRFCPAAFLVLLAACGAETAETPKLRLVPVVEVQAADQSAERRFTGRLRAVDRTRIAFEVGGIVETIEVGLGDRFKAGDTLAVMDETQARASMQAARAGLKEARADFANAQADAARYLPLRGSGAVAESRIDQAVLRRDAAGQRADRLRADLDRAEEALSDHRLTAPYDGVVSDRLAEPADVVAVGQPILAVTGEAGGVEALIQIPESAIGLLPVGRDVKISSSASGRIVSATVTEVASAAGAAGLVDVVAQIVGAGLTPGGRAELIVTDRRLPNGVLLPHGAFATAAGDTATVFVLDGDKVSARTVRIGAMTDYGLIATEGLSPGETIAAKGASRLRDGETVRTIKQGLTRYDG